MDLTLATANNQIMNKVLLALYCVDYTLMNILSSGNNLTNNFVVSFSAILYQNLGHGQDQNPHHARRYGCCLGKSKQQKLQRGTNPNFFIPKQILRLEKKRFQRNAYDSFLFRNFTSWTMSCPRRRVTMSAKMLSQSWPPKTALPLPVM